MSGKANVNPPSLTGLRFSIADQLCKIEDMLSPAYKLTLLARNTEKPNADILMSADDIADVIKAIESLRGAK